MQKAEGALCAYTNLEPAPASPTAIPAAPTQRKPAAPHLAYSPLLKPPPAISSEIRSPTRATSGPLKPALISIRDACFYMGGMSRSKFYNHVLPFLDTVKIGRRTFVTTDSADRLITANQRAAQSQAGRPDIASTSAA